MRTSHQESLIKFTVVNCVEMMQQEKKLQNDIRLLVDKKGSAK